jgi:hypothetical protein
MNSWCGEGPQEDEMRVKEMMQGQGDLRVLVEIDGKEPKDRLVLRRTNDGSIYLFGLDRDDTRYEVSGWTVGDLRMEADDWINDVTSEAPDEKRDNLRDQAEKMLHQSLS